MPPITENEKRKTKKLARTMGKFVAIALSRANRSHTHIVMQQKQQLCFLLPVSINYCACTSLPLLLPIDSLFYRKVHFISEAAAHHQLALL